MSNYRNFELTVCCVGTGRFFETRCYNPPIYIIHGEKDNNVNEEDGLKKLKEMIDQKVGQKTV